MEIKIIPINILFIYFYITYLYLYITYINISSLLIVYVKPIKNPKVPRCAFGSWIKPWNENIINNFKVRHENILFLGYQKIFVGYLIYWIKYLLIPLYFGTENLRLYKISTAKRPVFTIKKEARFVFHSTQLVFVIVWSWNSIHLSLLKM